MTLLHKRPTWKKLAAHRREVEPQEMRDLFAWEPDRFEAMSLRLGDLLRPSPRRRP